MVRAGDRGGMTNEQIIGTHRMRVEGDTVLTRYIGVPELVDVQAIHRWDERELPTPGPVTAECARTWAQREGDNLDP